MPPNILLLTADDMDAATPGAFGGRAAATPRIDRLASEGMRFTRAHVPAAVCQPSRSAMLTGRWPHRNGAEGFEPIRDAVPVLTELLEERGYISGILGKVNHLQPVERFGWSFVRTMRELGMGRDPEAYRGATRAFLETARATGRPWFLMANAHDPHRPFHESRQERERFTEDERASYPAPSAVVDSGAADLGLPGFLPGLPPVRAEYAAYLGSSRRCDDVVGAVLDALAEAGEADSTIVVFLSDNGMAFPFAKANCYLRSTLTPFIIRWPGRVTPGSVDDRHFVSMLDLFPFFCEVAGAENVGDVDGRSIGPLLAGLEEPDRDAVHTVFHETSAKRRFEMRCLQDDEFGYIWNAWSDGSTTYQAENMEGDSWPAIVDGAAADPALARRVAHYRLRTPEELYRLSEDPDCVHDLAADPRFATVLDRYRERLGHWMRRTGDPLHDRFATTQPVADQERPGSYSGSA